MNAGVLCTFGVLLVACANDGGERLPVQEEFATTPDAAASGGDSGTRAPMPPVVSPSKDDAGEPAGTTATEVLGNKQGPVPLSGTFTSKGGRLTVTLSGSGYRAAGGTSGTLGLALTIDAVAVGTVNGFTNEPLSHKALPVRTFVVDSIAAGQHTLAVTAQIDTITDANDYFNATVMELR